MLPTQLFKILKKNLPGPFTFILPASSQLPKLFFFNDKGKMKTVKRATVGCRIPDDPVALSILSQLDEPLLVSSVPAASGSNRRREIHDGGRDDDDDGNDEDEVNNDDGGGEDGDDDDEEAAAAARKREKELAAWRGSSSNDGSGDEALNCMEEAGAKWRSAVDFIVDCGPRPSGGSSIFDMSTNGDPVLIRAGLGGEDFKD